MITAINKATGEVIELPSDTLEQIMDAWKVAQEYDKAAKSLKDQLKMLIPEFVDHTNKSEEVSNFQFKINSIQRMTYDKSVLRENLDEDTFDVLMKPDKGAVDKYLKENAEELGEASHIIRVSMVADGSPYQVIKLERLSR